MQDLDCLSDSSSIDDKEVDLYNFKKEYRKVYLKVEFLEQELYEKNLEIESLKNYKTYFYYALSGCVFWAYFSVVTNLLKN